MKKVSTYMKPKFVDFMRAMGSTPMTLVHQDSKPDHLLTLSEIIIRYNDKLSPSTIRAYSHEGTFPYPVAVLLSQRALAWLFLADEVEEYFSRMSSNADKNKQKYDEMLAKARKLQAKGARLRYKAKKMESKFIITTKESK